MNERIRLLKEKDKKSIPDVFEKVNDLYSRYIQKKITNDEYLYLIKNTLNKITVYQEKVIFDTKYGIFELNRKFFKRQKGMSKKYKEIKKIQGGQF